MLRPTDSGCVNGRMGGEFGDLKACAARPNAASTGGARQMSKKTKGLRKEAKKEKKAVKKARKKEKAKGWNTSSVPPKSPFST